MWQEKRKREALVLDFNGLLCLSDPLEVLTQYHVARCSRFEETSKIKRRSVDVLGKTIFWGPITHPFRSILLSAIGIRLVTNSMKTDIFPQKETDSVKIHYKCTYTQHTHSQHTNN